MRRRGVSSERRRSSCSSFKCHHLMKPLWNIRCCVSIVAADGLVLNTLRLRQIGRHFPDAIFGCIFVNENIQISIRISLKFVPKSPINNIPALVLIMAWRPPGDKPLSEPMMIRLLTHIRVTRPQWVKHQVISSHNANQHLITPTGVSSWMKVKFCFFCTNLNLNLNWISWRTLMATDLNSLSPSQAVMQFGQYWFR